MEKTNTTNLEVTGAYGNVQYAWAQVPEEFAEIRLQGATMFQKFDDGDVNPTELFSGNVPFVIGSSAQQNGLSSEVMYASFAMDELGCMGGEDHYRKSINRNWAETELMLTSATTFITDNAAQLASGGMPATFPPEFDAQKNSFSTYMAPLQMPSRTRPKEQMSR